MACEWPVKCVCQGILVAKSALHGCGSWGYFCVVGSVKEDQIAFIGLLLEDFTSGVIYKLLFIDFSIS